MSSMRSVPHSPDASPKYPLRQVAHCRTKSRRITEEGYVGSLPNVDLFAVSLIMNEKILASLRTELNEQTAQMRWSELQRYFAGGTLISVAPELDLIDAGARIAADDKASVQDWMNAGLLHRVSDAQALQWLAQDALLWTVVVKPWILVQHERCSPPASAQ